MNKNNPVIDERIIRCIIKAKDYSGVSRVGVFGSFARAEQTEDSDLDILYDYFYQDNETNGINSTFTFLDKLEDDLTHVLDGRKVDFTSYLGLLDSENEQLRQGILRDVVWVYERDG